MAVPLIHNPAAGGGRGKARFVEAHAKLAARGIDVEPVETQRPGHAAELARSMAQAGHKTIFVLGGDGTFSEAASGILGLPARRRPTLGILPAGTGNDFLRDFGVTTMDAALDRLEHGRPHPVDASLCIDGQGARHWSVNIFGTGFAAEVVDLTNRRLKWMRGQAYNAAVLARLAALSPTPTRLVLDGVEHVGDYPLVMACNTVHTGAAMRMAPMARPDDGWLDVLTIEGVNRRQLVRLLVQVADGSHVDDPKVTFHRARRVEVHPERQGPLLVDGEVVGTTPATLEVHAGALKVLL